jgi:two-component system cell cycle response regulator CtrA
MGVDLLSLYRYDAVVIACVSNTEGRDTLVRVRPSTNLPVIVFVVQYDEEEEIGTLKCGADLYIDESISEETLHARLCALVRRYNGHASSILTAGHLSVDIQDRRVFISKGDDRQEISLTSSQYLILECLALKRYVVGRQLLLDKLYAENVDVGDRIIDEFVKRLRKRIMAVSGDEDYIYTRYGYGYELLLVIRKRLLRSRNKSKNRRVRT